MKMIWIMYNMGIDEEVINTLHAMKINFYTKFPQCVGVGALTGPRLDSHVWPGANNAILIIIEKERADHLMNVLQRLRETIGQHEGLFAFEADVTRVTH